MIFFVLILLLLIFNEAKFYGSNEFNKNYISKDDTLAIKGIFVALILLSHAKGYCNLNGIYDEPYVQLQNHLNQMVVAMFLFYSGFGMMESIKKKQFDYVASIPKKRFPHLLLIYDIAIVMYAIMDIALGKHLTVKQMIDAFTGWNGIGNSSWYIFVIFVLYIFTFIAFLPKAFTQNKAVELVSIIILAGLGVVLILALKKAGKEGFWYNTLFLFIVGFVYSYFKDVIEKIVMKSDITYFITLCVVIVAYIESYMNRWHRLLFYECWAICFVALVVLLTMKISLQNPVLKFLGNHVFSIYILQRIPMIIFDHMGISSRHKYVFMIISIAVTLFMAVTYDKITPKIASLIWKKKTIEEK